jgi:hypothetical protein
MHTMPLPLPSDLDAVAVEITADGQAILYEPGDELPAHLVLPPAPSTRTITPGEFRDRFTPAEQTAFAALAFGGDTNAQVMLLKLSTSLEVNLDSPTVAAGLDYLVSKGVISAARKAEIQGI